MKTGTIIYISGSPSSQAVEKIKWRKELSRLGITSDQFEFVAPDVGHYDIQDAWWSLTVKGMQKIQCLMARCSPHGRLEITGNPMRLCG